MDSLEKNKIPYKKILAGKLRRYFSVASIVDLVKIPIGFLQSFWYVFLFMPDVVFSKGGYGSVAPSIIARLFFIPVFVHESDSIPGLANKIIGSMAKTVFNNLENIYILYQKKSYFFYFVL